MASATKEMALRAPKRIVVQTAAFQEGKPIPKDYSAFGEDVSPPLQWTQVPSETEAVAILVDDPDAPSGTFTHWIVVDLPRDVTTLERGADIEALGGIEGQNDFHTGGYRGPKPPSGTHHYHFQVFALREKMGLGTDATADAFWRALTGKVLAWGEVVGTFSRT
ncbi:MAG: YbhB/YbcL family Raf kinase inhibitor-like protein [Thermoplasmatota archaeon]